MTEKAKQLQRKNKHNSGVDALHKSLSIQFSLDGFSFCITNALSKEIISFTEYTFNKTLATPELLLDKTLEIFSQEKALQQDFSNIKVIHQNNLATLVPNEYFDEQKLKTYLDFNIKTLANDYIVFDDINTINAKNVYIPFVNINNYLFQNFGEFEFKHHSTVLIQKLIENNNTDKKQFFVNVSSKNIDVVVIKENNLLLYNSFPFNTKEDFIYYILFVAEQLELNPNEFQLTFLGDIEPESEIYNITYNYVRNINFIKPLSNFFSSSNDFSNHSNYTLIS